LSDIGAYTDARDHLGAAAFEAARKCTQKQLAVRVNAADDLQRGLVFLSVTGTSAEAGDDGQTGRGNRANGLITPFRPMTLEALAGKNPITHVGKLYNAAASRVAGAIVGEVPEIFEAECHLVSEIGAPIDEPKLALIRVRSANSGLAQETERSIRSIAEREIGEIAGLWEKFMAGDIAIA
jgi:S-adenosylmethionine synthetase